MKRLSGWIAAVVLSASLGACAQGPVQPEEGVGTAENWTAPGGAADETSYSRLDQIDTGNADELGLAWYMDLPEEVTLESTPLAIDGTLYFSGGYAEVYAVDAVTGKQLWKFDPKTWQRSPGKMHFGANRGIAYENGMIYTAEMDGRITALDARTGNVVWSEDTIPPEEVFNNSTGAPRTMNGKVIIGNGGADLGARGFVTALDGKTGKFLWRFWTVPRKPEDNKGNPAAEQAEKTWSGEWWNVGTGGTVWNGMTFDPERNRVYIGVGNAGPYDAQRRNPQGLDNLYTTSIVALDADTGKYVWHYQQNPNDAWDYKSTPNIVMATLNLDGEAKKVLLHAPTNGFFYVLDRDTGKLINEPGKTTFINWAKGIDMKTGRPIENPGIRYETADAEIWPGAVGGHNWQAMSYSPRTGLVYIPIQQLGTRFTRKVEEVNENGFNVMGLVVEPIAKQEGDGKGYLVAWDPVAQKERWRVANDVLWNGGTLATAGGLVFQGTGDGHFNAYDAGSGKRLWTFNAGHGIIAAPMSFSAGGKQYVSILVGYGGTSAAYGKFMDVGWKYGAQMRRLLTFAVGGTAKLPAMPGPDFKVYALDDPELTLDPQDVAVGRMQYLRCASCHGVGAQSTGTPGPDLRESAIALRLDTFTQFVNSGRMEKGMPAFAGQIDPTAMRQIHAYIRSRARDALGIKAATPAGPPPMPVPGGPASQPKTPVSEPPKVGL
jgi:quinohemoprotein ethanol dehydrogenase